MAVQPNTLQRRRLGETAAGPISLVQLIRPSFEEAYETWLSASDEAVAWAGGSRTFAVNIDEVLTPGKQIYGKLVIDTFTSPAACGRALDTTSKERGQAMSAAEMLVVRGGRASALSRLRNIGPKFGRFLKEDASDPSKDQMASDPSVSPSPEGVARFLERDQSQPVFVVNLNKYNPRAKYPDGDRGRTGKQAYNRYSRYSLPRLLALGGYPAFDGSVIGTVVGDAGDTIFDTWNTFLLVSYPTRDHFLRMFAGQGLAKGIPHRNAALQRAVIMSCSPA